MGHDSLKQIVQTAYDRGWTRAQTLATFHSGFDGVARKQARSEYPDLDKERKAYQWAFKVGIMSYLTDALDQFEGTRDLSVILTVVNQENSIETLIQEVQRLKPKEIIVIVDGQIHAKAKIAQHYGCKIMQVEEKVGHDVGRGLGAVMAKGSTVLFLDSNHLIQAEQLLPFVWAIELEEADLALTNIDPVLPKPKEWDPVTVMRHVLNQVLNHPDLGSASMTVFPYAIRRSVLHELPKGFMLTPPKAYAHIVSSGHRVLLANTIDVTRGKIKRKNHLVQKIVDDHFEVIAWLQEQVKGDIQEPIESVPRPARVIVSDDPLDTFAAEAIYQGGEAIVEKALPPSTALLHCGVADVIQEGLKHLADSLVPLQKPQEVARLLLDAVEQKRGYSLIRLGESELLTLAHGTVLSEEKVQDVGKYILPSAGVSIPNHKARDELLDAIQKADLIGIPTHRGPTLQGLMHKLIKFYRLPLQKMTFTASRIQYELDELEGFYRQLCSNRRIVLIGNKMLELQPEFAKQGYSIVGAIPDDGVMSVETVMGQVQRCEFDVALVSAGVASVSICQKIGQLGKVAVDLGRLADRMHRQQRLFT